MALLVGVDVQGDTLIVALRRDGVFLPPATVAEVAYGVRDYALQHRQHEHEQVVVAIDAPRHYLAAPRQWALNGAGNQWVPANLPHGWGRHCEIVVRRLGLANPQWTPIAAHPRPWITLGQQVFAVCQEAGFATIECFPGATYTRLGQMVNQNLHIPGAVFAYNRLAHDILDACVAAYTAEFFVAGNATELGGGDGYGTIVVPGIVPVPFPPFPQIM